MNKEQAYDSMIAPLMTQIIEISNRNGIAFFASFSIPTEEDDDLLCTTHQGDGNGVTHPIFDKCHDIVRPRRHPPMMITTTHADGSKTMTAILP